MKRLGIVAMVVTCTVGCGTHSTVVTDVHTVIMRDGPTAAAKRLASNEDEWNSFLKTVRAGDPAALATAEVLHTATDAGASRDLELAFGSALTRNPKGVLKVLQHVSDSIACGSPDTDLQEFDSPQRIKAELERRRQMLRGVSDQSLLAARDSCLSVINKALTNIGM